MLTLHLALYEGDVCEIEFNSITSLLEYLEELKMFNCIWLVTNEGPYSELIITENLTSILYAISSEIIKTDFKKGNLFVQEYQSFQSAYESALLMKEGNERCYD